ncbi:PaaI family thioesterase [Rubrivirga sp. IMCC45206]|uniref:PaaI family thioesterase n=1 Tax=Rubrivirga sp. IMCC45206 TaxID=3391614 RepID=UPI00398FBA92
MPTFEPRDPGFEARVRASFARQRMMQTLGAELVAVRPGEVAIALPFRADLTQQHGYLHAAATTAIADSACGYAALSLMAPGHDVLSVEFKVNLLAPAAGDRFVAVGRVLRPGRTLTVCAAEVRAERGDERPVIAAMQATMIALAPRETETGPDG